MESLSRANSVFALDLYWALSANSPDGNLFFSPLSISAALSMVYLGARGITAEEMAKVMSFSSVPEVRDQFSTLNSAINSPQASYILRLANRLYGEKTVNFLPEFVNSTQKLYQAEMQAADFIGAAEETRQLINHWVEEKTENKIKDLVKPGMVDASTQLALVNAIYFKGRFMTIFGPKLTKEMPFKINKNKTKPVQMMFQADYFPYKYINEYRLHVLELPYVEDELSMLVLLPVESRDGPDLLQKLESEITVDKLLEWTSREKMGISNIGVHLPKFKLEEQYSLHDTLAKMGMSSLFKASAADLSGMSRDGGLRVSSVAHKAFVEVSEREPAEAINQPGTSRDRQLCVSPGLHKASLEVNKTAVNIIYPVNCNVTNKYFLADHPFLFFIRHIPTNSILFLGRFRGPC